MSIGCRSGSPAPEPQPAPERAGEDILESARREVEQGIREPKSALGALHVPTQPEGQHVPLIVFLHGLGGSGSDLVASLHLNELADALGFAFIAPDGMLDYSGRRFWNASESCCNFDHLAVDHVALLRQWISDALHHPRLDPARVYLVGYSNGGFLAYRAACELGSTLLRGIFSIGGAGPNDLKSCRPARPLDVVEIHGDKDAIVDFKGGYLFADRSRPKHPSAEASLRFWRKLDGCSEVAEVRTHLDLDPRIPGAETEVFSYPNCKSGEHVELWRIHGGDHAAGLSRYSVNAIWEAIQADTL